MPRLERQGEGREVWKEDNKLVPYRRWLVSKTVKQIEKKHDECKMSALAGRPTFQPFSNNNAIPPDGPKAQSEGAVELASAPNFLLTTPFLQQTKTPSSSHLAASAEKCRSDGRFDLPHEQSIDQPKQLTHKTWSISSTTPTFSHLSPPFFFFPFPRAPFASSLPLSHPSTYSAFHHQVRAKARSLRFLSLSSSPTASGRNQKADHQNPPVMKTIKLPPQRMDVTRSDSTTSSYETKKNDKKVL